MTRTHGRSAVGQRLVAKVPHGHRKTLTFVAALRCDGITAPCVFDGPIDGVSFLAWVIQFLVPILRRGDVVVMDNLSSHKARGPSVGRSGRPERCSYSCRPTAQTLRGSAPKPIEQAFSQLKTLLRKESARGIEQTTACIGKLLGQVTAKASANYFREAGYST